MVSQVEGRGFVHGMHLKVLSLIVKKNITRKPYMRKNTIQ